MQNDYDEMTPFPEPVVIEITDVFDLHTIPPREVKFGGRLQSPKEPRWAVWERDDFTCQSCGARRNLSIDHIVPEHRLPKI